MLTDAQKLELGKLAVRSLFAFTRGAETAPESLYVDEYAHSFDTRTLLLFARGCRDALPLDINTINGFQGAILADYGTAAQLIIDSLDGKPRRYSGKDPLAAEFDNRPRSSQPFSGHDSGWVKR